MNVEKVKTSFKQKCILDALNCIADNKQCCQCQCVYYSIETGCQQQSIAKDAAELLASLQHNQTVLLDSFADTLKRRMPSHIIEDGRFVKFGDFTESEIDKIKQKVIQDNT